MGLVSINTITNFLFGQALISSPTYGEIMADIKVSEDHTRKMMSHKQRLRAGPLLLTMLLFIRGFYP